MTETVSVLQDIALQSDGFLILSSETGCIDIPPEKIVKKDRLRPGKMLLADTKQGRLIDDDEVKSTYASRQPYGEWLDSNLVRLHDLHIPNKNVRTYAHEELAKLQKAFGYSYEDIRSSILPMAEKGAEPIASMGSDIPLPPLDKENIPLFNYFRQLFAQVTNPPFDAIREEIVTDTSMYIGEDGNILEEKPENCRVLKIENPILTETDMLKIKSMNVKGLKTAVIPITYYIGTPLEKAIDRLFIEADKAYRDGANILILSDRDVDEYHVPSRPCLRLQDFSSTWFPQRSVLLWLLSLKVQNRVKFTILQRFSVMALVLLTRISHRKLSATSLIQECSIRTFMQQRTITITEFSTVSLKSLQKWAFLRYSPIRVQSSLKRSVFQARLSTSISAVR